MFSQHINKTITLKVNHQNSFDVSFHVQSKFFEPVPFVIHFVQFLFARPSRTTQLKQPHSSYLFVRQLFTSLHSSQLLQTHRLRLCQKHNSYCVTAVCSCTARCKTLTRVSIISKRNYHCRYQNYRFWMTHNPQSTISSARARPRTHTHTHTLHVHSMVQKFSKNDKRMWNVS
jgi:hypothetical protein